MTAVSAALEAIVLLNARWATLEHHNTRWRRVVQAWAADSGMHVTVVDYPAFRPKRLLAPVRVAGAASWLDGVDVLAVDVPLPPRRTPIDGVVWSRVAAAVERALPEGERLVVATTPLWVPLARRLRARVRSFDGIGDWRRQPEMRELHGRFDAGYREARDLDVTTVVSDGMRATFAELGLPSVVVGNGVDLDAFAGEPAAPDGLPDAPFAVYVGAIEGRVDLGLLEAVAATGLATVVAGPADGATAERLRRGPLLWLGPVSTDLVPGLLHRAAVGLVPHHVGPLTATMDPMKVLEYLAAGLPVVSTPVDLPPDVAARVERVAPTDLASAAARAATRAREIGPDPVVSGRDWSAVARTLLDTYLAVAR